jgi:hypothetical protein
MSSFQTFVKPLTNELMDFYLKLVVLFHFILTNLQSQDKASVNFICKCTLFDPKLKATFTSYVNAHLNGFNFTI